MSTITSILLFLLAPILLLSAVIDWILETPSDRAKRWRQDGLSKREIGRRLGVSQYRVNKFLAS